MKHRFLLILLTISMSFSACGSSEDISDDTYEENTYEENSSTTEDTNDNSGTTDEAKEEPFQIYTVNKLGLLNPPEVTIDDADECWIYNISWGVAYETVYRFFSVETDSDTFFGIQTLTAPYAEWENHIIKPEEWIEDETCIPVDATLTDYGEIYVLLDGNNDNYIGKWSLAKGCSASVLECEYPIFSHEVWCSGDEIGNFFIINDTGSGKMYNYEALWLDLQFQKREELLPDKTVGYVWKVAETPFSGIPYLLGCDASSIDISADSMRINNTGFSIWTEGQDAPVFTTPHTGMTLEDTVIFYSDTEGYLLNYAGIWDFSIADNSITSVKNIFVFWEDASLRKDDSVLMVSKEYNQKEDKFEYYLWEMFTETVKTINESQ